MKKPVVIICLITMLALLAVMTFGIKVGGLRIGNQDDTANVVQHSKIAESPFATKYLESDKLVCVNLWATWCEPCLVEIPMLNEIKSEFAKENVEFISLSVDKDLVQLAKFNKNKRFHFIDITVENLEYRTAIVNYLQNKPSDNSINSLSIPMTYLIKNKKVVKTFDESLENKEKLVEAINSIL